MASPTLKNKNRKARKETSKGGRRKRELRQELRKKQLELAEKMGLPPPAPAAKGSGNA